MLQIIQQYEHSVKFWYLELDPGLNYAPTLVDLNLPTCTGQQNVLANKKETGS